MSDEARRYREVDSKLVDISKQISFLDMNPINEEEEMSKFFSDSEGLYNPIFTYSNLDFDYDKVIKEIDKLDIRYTTLDAIFRKKAMKLKSMARMLKNRGSVRSHQVSEKIYGSPSSHLISQAKDILAKPLKKEKEPDLTTKQIIRALNKAFIKFGFNWYVIEKDMTASAAVNVSKKQLMIKKNSRFSRSFVKRLIVHEIGTHVLRAENGSRQPYKIFRFGLPHYMMTEEGLAVYNEEINNCLNQEMLRRYAARVLAVSKAQSSSFRETFDFLKQFLDEGLAWRTTTRVKRGLKDTSMHGAFTKDYLYLKGYYEVKKYIEKGGDIEKLYYGKVGIEHVEYLDKIPNLTHPVYIPIFRYFQFFIDIMKELVKFNIKVILTPVLYPLGISPYKKLFNKDKNIKNL